MKEGREKEADDAIGDTAIYGAALSGLPTGALDTHSAARSPWG